MATITTAYDKIRDSLKTGDIVLFSGKGAVSQGIKRFTFSHWSHVGMVIKSKEFDSILVWESTTLNDVTKIKGVQISPLGQRIASYRGSVSIRKLKVKRDKALLASLVQLRHKLRGRKYEESEIELIKSAYDGPFGHNTEDLSSLFCSELVAEAYQQMGLLSEEKPSNEYTPADFSYKKRNKLKLLKGSLGKERKMS